jgi:hypothetical protein
MPTAQDYGGMSAYSAGPMYDAALAELQRRQPETYNAIMAQFGGTAGAGGGVGSSASATGYVPTMEPRMPQREGRDSMPAVRAPAATGTGSLGLPDPMSGNITSVGPIGRSGGGGLGGRK